MALRKFTTPSKSREKDESSICNCSRYLYFLFAEALMRLHAGHHITGYRMLNYTGQYEMNHHYINECVTPVKISFLYTKYLNNNQTCPILLLTDLTKFPLLFYLFLRMLIRKMSILLTDFATENNFVIVSSQSEEKRWVFTYKHGSAFQNWK
ncbi:hypothetical protein BDB01DRAFT_878363 [Pilobolus umbonatus]|nr:hypothetical protein BDB01DRAFT_878363 [Pilobolus umbonatus]